MQSQHHRMIRILGLFVLLFLCASSVFAQEGEHRDLMNFFQAFTLPRVWVAYVVALIGFFLLIKGWVRKTIRLWGMGVVLFVFGIFSALPLGTFAVGMGMHPSPMCMIEKPILFLHAGRGIPVFFFGMLASVAVLSILGNKLFCGWVCPVGAFQELMHRLPVRKFRLPFKVSNSVRIGFFIVFLISLMTAGISLYQFVNPFEFFHFSWQLLGVIVVSVIALAGMFVFRPFCYLICPMGLFTWLLEHVSVFRVNKKEGDCGKCRICIEQSPCPSVKAIVDQKWSRPDCHACGRCIELCPNHKLSFRTKNKK